MRSVTQFIPSSLETSTPPLEGAYVCAPANHVAHGHARPVWASNGGRARTRPSAVHAPLPASPLGRTRPSTVCALGRARPYFRACPYYRPHPTTIRAHTVCALGRACPTRRARPPCAPIEAIHALPRTHLFNISSSKLLFILPLGHPGLQLS
jgi:hypothetical protein